MKDRIKLFLFSFLACFCLFSVVSCDDDDEEEKVVKPEPERFAEFNYIYNCSEDFLKVADITVTYTDVDNKSVTEVMKGKEWKKAMRAKRPFAAKMEVIYTVKEGFVPAQESYRFEETCGVLGNLHSGKRSIKGEDVVAYIKRLGETKHIYSHDFN